MSDYTDNISDPEEFKKEVIEDTKERILESLENITYNSVAEGCGLEDLNIQDPYEAMAYGWERAMFTVRENIENFE